MSDKVNLKLISATGSVLNHHVDMVIVPGYEGDMGILPHHAPLIAQLRPGLVRLYEDNSLTQQIFITDGFVHIDDSGCTVLAKQWTLLEQLNKQDLEHQRDNLKHELDITDDPARKQILQDHLGVISVQMNILK